MVRAKLTKLLSLIAVVCFFTSLAHGQEFRAFVMGTGSFLGNERFFTNVNQRFRRTTLPAARLSLVENTRSPTFSEPRAPTVTGATTCE